MQITLEPRRVVIFLGLSVIVLVSACAATLFLEYGLGFNHVFGLVELFNLGTESNIPTWWSSTLLLISSLLLFLIAKHHTERRDRSIGWWWALAVIMLIVSIDEAAMIHERIGNSFGNRVLKATDLDSTYKNQRWVLLYGPLVLIGLALIWRFLQSLPRRTGRLFKLSAVVFVFGAIGVEMLSSYIGHEYGEGFFWAVTLVEETLEMAGVVIFIGALLDYLANMIGGVDLHIRFGSPPAGGHS